MNINIFSMEVVQAEAVSHFTLYLAVRSEERKHITGKLSASRFQKCGIVTGCLASLVRCSTSSSDTTGL